jgi:SAP domain
MRQTHVSALLRSVQSTAILLPLQWSIGLILYFALFSSKIRVSVLLLPQTNLNLTQLKAKCRSLGLPCSGSKDAIVERLLKPKPKEASAGAKGHSGGAGKAVSHGDQAAARKRGRTGAKKRCVVDSGSDSDSKKKTADADMSREGVGYVYSALTALRLDEVITGDHVMGRWVAYGNHQWWVARVVEKHSDGTISLRFLGSDPKPLRVNLEDVGKRIPARAEADASDDDADDDDDDGEDEES